MTEDYDNLLEKAEELVTEVENVIQNYMEYNVGSCDLKNFEDEKYHVEKTWYTDLYVDETEDEVGDICGERWVSEAKVYHDELENR